MTQKEIKPSRLPSITEDFNPALPLDAVTQYELTLKQIAEQVTGAATIGLRIREIAGGTITEIPQIEYNVESYPAENYQILDTIEVMNPEVTEVSVRDLVLRGDKVLVVVAKRLDQMDKSVIPQFIRLQKEAEKSGIPLLFITNTNPAAIKHFRQKYGFNVPTFINDETELKIISRSNPCLLVLKRGTVLGKYTRTSIPDFEWIEKNLYSKK
jgi:thiol-disulfide isomerase/thioredoxin